MPQTYPQEYLDYQAKFYNAAPESFYNLTLEDYMLIIKTGLDHSMRHLFVTEFYNFPIQKLEVKTKCEPLGFAFDQMCEVLLNFPDVQQLSVSVKQELLHAIGLELALARDYRALGSVLYSVKDKEVEKVNFEDPKDVVTEIDRISGKMYKDTKHCQVNTIIATPSAYEKLKNSPQFVPVLNHAREGIYEAGDICGIKVIVCPSDSSLLKDGQVLFLYKGIEPHDTSVAIRNEAEVRNPPAHILADHHMAEYQTITAYEGSTILGAL